MYRRFALKISPILSLLFALQMYSCNEAPKKVNLLDSFVGYCENSPATIVSGKLCMKDVLNDLSYTNTPKLNEILAKELLQLKKGIQLDAPIYFSVDSLFNPDGIPTDLKLFLSVQNKDSITDQLRTYGLFVSHEDSLDIVIKDNFAIGINEHFMVIHYSSNSSKKSLKQVFRQLLASVATSKLSRLLHDPASISINFHLKNIVALTNPTKGVVKNSIFNGSYIHNTIHFQHGAMVGKTNFDFSEMLKKRLFFNTKSATSNPFEHPSSNMVAGLRFTFSPTKLETLLEDYFPQLIPSLARNSTEMQIALLTLGEKPIQSLLSGDIELRMTHQNQHLIPEYTIGLGENKAMISQLVNSPSLSSLPFYATKNQLLSKEQSTFGQQPMLAILKPSKAYSLFGFIDFNKVYEMYQNDPLSAGFKALNSFEIHGDAQQISWEIQAKAKNKGILYQIVMQYYRELERQMSQSQIVF